MNFLGAMFIYGVASVIAYYNLVQLLKTYHSHHSSWSEVQNESREVLAGNLFLVIASVGVACAQMIEEGLLESYIFWVLAIGLIPLIVPIVLLIVSTVALKSKSPNPLSIPKRRRKTEDDDLIESVRDALQATKAAHAELDEMRNSQDNNRTTNDDVIVTVAMAELKPIMEKTPVGSIYNEICNEAKSVPAQEWDNDLAFRMKEHYLPALGKLAACYAEAPKKIQAELKPELNKMLGLLRDIVSEATSDAYEKKVATIRAEIATTQVLAKMRGDVAVQEFELETKTEESQKRCCT